MGFTPSEPELVDRAKNGEEGAYRELFDLHFSRVFRVALSYVGSSDEAKDICQTAFIRAFESLDLLDNTEKFGPWIASITQKAAIDFLRKRKRMAEAPLSLEKAIDNLIWASGNDDHRAKELEAEVVREIISSIPDDSTRETVKMFYTEEGMTTEEIAMRQGVPRSTVTSRLSRFRARYHRKIMRRILALRGEV